MIPRGGVWKHKQHRESRPSARGPPAPGVEDFAGLSRSQEGGVGSFICQRARGPEASESPYRHTAPEGNHRARVVGKIAGRAWNTILDSSQRADYNSLPPG